MKPNQCLFGILLGLHLLSVGVPAQVSPSPREDLFFVTPQAGNFLLVNREASGWERNDGFPPAALTNYQLAVTGDFDANGWEDLFLMDRTGRNQLLYRRGDRWENGNPFDRRDVEGGEIEITKIDVVLAIDSSGSMSDNDPRKLRLAAAKSFIDRLNPQQDRVAVISWDDNVDFVQPLTSNFGLAKAAVDRVDMDGGTSLNAGLHAALNQFQSNGRPFTEAGRLIVFLTDGEGSYTLSSAAGSPGARARALGVMVVAIGLGKDPADEQLIDIAQATGGRFTRTADASALEQVFRNLKVPWNFDIVVSGDFNGDRRHDLFFYSKTGNSRTQTSQPGPAAWSRSDGSIHANDIKGFDAIAAGDFDGNGTDDLFFLNRNGSNRVYLALQGGGWGAGGSFPEPALEPYDFVATGDFDGNLKDDLLLWGSGGSAVYYSRNSWQPSPGDVRENPAGYQHVVPVDYDGDGLDELMLVGVTGSTVLADRVADANWAIVTGPLVPAERFTAVLAGHFRGGDTTLTGGGVTDGMPAPYLTEPAPGSVLQGQEVSFAWASSTPPAAYRLKVGKQPGTAEIFGGAELSGQTLRQNVSGLPADGSVLHVTLEFRRNDQEPWQWRQYTFTAISRPELLTPAPGSAISDPVMTFTWRPAPAASHWLKIGTQPGRSDLLDTGAIADTQTSAQATGLPVDGRPVYVSLQYRYQSFLSWVSLDYVFQTERRPELTSPLPGQLIGDPPVQFVWTANNRSVAAWRFTLGDAAGGTNIFDSGELPGATTSQIITALPMDGPVLHATLSYKTTAGGNWISIPYEYGFITLQTYEEVLKTLNDPVTAAQADPAFLEAKKRIDAQNAELLAKLVESLPALRQSGDYYEELKVLVDIFNLRILNRTESADMLPSLQRAVQLMRALSGNLESRPADVARLFTRLARIFDLLAERSAVSQRVDYLKLSSEAYELSVRALTAAVRQTAGTADPSVLPVLNQALSDNAGRAIHSLFQADLFGSALATARRLADFVGGAAGARLLWRSLDTIERIYPTLTGQQQQELDSLANLRACKKAALEQMIAVEDDALKVAEYTLSLTRSLADEGRFADAINEIDRALLHFIDAAEEDRIPAAMLYGERLIFQAMSVSPLPPAKLTGWVNAIPEEYRTAGLALAITHLGAMRQRPVLRVFGTFLEANAFDAAVRVHYWEALLLSLSTDPRQDLVETELQQAGDGAEAFLATLSAPPLDAELLAGFTERVTAVQARNQSIASIQHVLVHPAGVDFRGLAKDALTAGRWDLVNRSFGRHLEMLDLPPSQRTPDVLARRVVDVLEILRLFRIRFELPDVPQEDLQIARQYFDQAVEHLLWTGRERIAQLRQNVIHSEAYIHVTGMLDDEEREKHKVWQKEVLRQIQRLARSLAAAEGMRSVEPVISATETLRQKTDDRFALMLRSFTGIVKLDASNTEQHKRLREAIGEIRALRAERDGRIDYITGLPDPAGKTFRQSQQYFTDEVDLIFEKLNAAGGVRELRVRGDSIWASDADAVLHELVFTIDEEYFTGRRFEFIATYPYWDFTKKKQYLGGILQRERQHWEFRAGKDAEAFYQGRDADTWSRLLGLLGEAQVSGEVLENLGTLGAAMEKARRDLETEENKARRQSMGAQLVEYRSGDTQRVIQTMTVPLRGGGSYERKITAAQKAFGIVVLMQQDHLTAQRDKYVYSLHDYQDTSYWDLPPIKKWKTFFTTEGNLDAFDDLAGDYAKLHDALIRASVDPLPKLSKRQRSLLEAKGFIRNGRYVVPTDAELKQMDITLGDELTDESGILYMVDRMFTPRDLAITVATIYIPGAAAGRVAGVASRFTGSVLTRLTGATLAELGAAGRVLTFATSKIAEGAAFTVFNRAARVAIDPDLLFDGDFMNWQGFREEVLHNIYVVASLGAFGGLRQAATRGLDKAVTAILGRDGNLRQIWNLFAVAGTVVAEGSLLTTLNAIAASNTITRESLAENIVLVAILKGMHSSHERVGGGTPVTSTPYERMLTNGLDPARPRQNILGEIVTQRSSPMVAEVRRATGNGVASVREAAVLADLSSELGVEFDPIGRLDGVLEVSARRPQSGEVIELSPEQISRVAEVARELPGGITVRNQPAVDLRYAPLVEVTLRFNGMEFTYHLTSGPQGSSNRIFFLTEGGQPIEYSLLRVSKNPMFEAAEQIVWLAFEQGIIDNSIVRLPARQAVTVVELQGDPRWNSATMMLVENMNHAQSRRYLAGSIMSARAQLEGRAYLDVAEQLAFARGINELNSKGFVFLDCHFGNFGFEHTPQGLRLVIVDPGAIVRARSPGAARTLQETMFRYPEPAPDIYRDPAEWNRDVERVNGMRRALEILGQQEGNQSTMDGLERRLDTINAKWRNNTVEEFGDLFNLEGTGLTHPNQLSFRADGLFRFPGIRDLLSVPTAELPARIETMRQLEQAGLYPGMEPPLPTRAFREVLTMPVPLTEALAASDILPRDFRTMVTEQEGRVESQSQRESQRLYTPDTHSTGTERNWWASRPGFTGEVQAGVRSVLEQAAAGDNPVAQWLVAEIVAGQTRVELDSSLDVLVRSHQDPATGIVTITANPFARRTPAAPGAAERTLRSLADIAGSIYNEYVRIAGWGAIRGWHEQSAFTRAIGNAAAVIQNAVSRHPEVAKDAVFAEIQFRDPPDDGLAAEDRELLNVYVAFELRNAQPFESLASQRAATPVVNTPPAVPVESQPTPGLPFVGVTVPVEFPGSVYPGPAVGIRLEATTGGQYVLADITGDGDDERIYRTAAGIVAESRHPASGAFIRLPGVLTELEFGFNLPTYPVLVARFTADRRAGILARLSDGIHGWLYDAPLGEWEEVPGIIPLRDGDGYNTVGSQSVADVTGDGVVELLSFNCCNLQAWSYDSAAGQWRGLTGSIPASRAKAIADLTGDGAADVLYHDVHQLHLWTYDRAAQQWAYLPNGIRLTYAGNWWDSIQVRKGAVHAESPHGHLTATYNPDTLRWEYPLALSDPGSPTDILFVKYEWSCATANSKWTLHQIDSWLQTTGRLLETRTPLFESEVSCFQPAPGLPAFLLTYDIPAQDAVDAAYSLGWDRTDRYQDFQIRDGTYHAQGEHGHLTARFNAEAGAWEFPLALSSPASASDLLFVRYEWNCIGDQWTLVQVDSWRQSNGGITQYRFPLLSSGISSQERAPLIPAGLTSYETSDSVVLQYAASETAPEPSLSAGRGGVPLSGSSQMVWYMADLTGDGMAERITWDASGIRASSYDPARGVYRLLPGTLQVFPDRQDPVFAANVLPNGRAAIVTRWAEGIFAWTYDAGGQGWSALARSAPLNIFGPGTIYPMFLEDVTGDAVADLITRTVQGLEVYSYDSGAPQWRRLPGTLEALSDANGFREPLPNNYLRVGDVTGDAKADLIHWTGFEFVVSAYDVQGGRWITYASGIPAHHQHGWSDPALAATLHITDGVLRAQSEFGELAARFLLGANRWEYFLGLSAAPLSPSTLYVSYRWICEQGFWALSQRDSWQSQQGQQVWIEREVNSSILRSTIPCSQPAPGVPSFERILELARLTSATPDTRTTPPGPEPPLPSLYIELVSGEVLLSWEDPLDKFKLEISSDPSGPWSQFPRAVSAASWSTRFVTDSTVSQRQFYRLRKQ